MASDAMSSALQLMLSSGLYSKNHALKAAAVDFLNVCCVFCGPLLLSQQDSMFTFSLES